MSKNADKSSPEDEEQRATTREKFRKKLHAGELSNRTVELTVSEKPYVLQGFVAGIEEIGMDFQNMLEKMVPQRAQVRKVSVAEAKRILTHEEAEKLIDKEKVIQEAIHRTENFGILFIDEIDKIAGRESSHGPDVSREGVQRDLLPIVDGTTVHTRYGIVKDRPHPVYCSGGVSRLKAIGPHSGTARPFSHPCGTGGFGEGRVFTHPHGA